MEPTATPELAAAMDRPATDVPDFDRVVALYWPRVFRFLLASLRDRDAAETLTQDCFLRAFKGWHRFRGDSSINTWLMRIAINLSRDHLRSRRLQFWKRAQSCATDPAEIGEWLPDRKISPEQKAVLQEQVEAVWAATDSLSRRQRTVFLLRFVEDMDLLEIARATGLTEGAVKVHLFRAVRVVRERIRRLQ